MDTPPSKMEVESGVFFMLMYNLNRFLWMIVGFLVMVMVFVIYGFFDTQIPCLCFLLFWLAGAGALYHGASVKPHYT